METQHPQIALPRIGEHWLEQGGIYIGEMLGENGQPNHHLILPLDPRANFGNWVWGKRGQLIEGCNHIRDGLANTRAMAEADSDLAKQILALEIDGFNDFYLPSISESFYCFAVAREHFDKEWHWTSTQHSAYTAYMQHFGDGSTDYGYKDFSDRARVVRRFVINSTIQ